jgi:hypothetical protein
MLFVLFKIKEAGGNQIAPASGSQGECSISSKYFPTLVTLVHL